MTEEKKTRSLEEVKAEILARLDAKKPVGELAQEYEHHIERLQTETDRANKTIRQLMENNRDIGGFAKQYDYFYGLMLDSRDDDSA